MEEYDETNHNKSHRKPPLERPLRLEKNIDSLEQEVRDLAYLVETVRQQTLLPSKSRVEALKQKARELARSLESARKEARLQSTLEIADLSQQARKLVVLVDSAWEETRLRSNEEMEGRITANTPDDQSAVLLAAVAESSGDAILTTTLDGIVTSWNAGAERLYGRTAAEALGRHVKDLKQQTLHVVPSEENTQLSNLMASDMAIHKLNADIEHNVSECTGPLDTANEELENFSHPVSYDLHAPLRAVDGLSGILLEEYAASLPAEGINVRTRTRLSTQHMSHWVDDLLAFSRLGRLGLTKQTVHTATIVRQCLSEIQVKQDNRQIEIEIGELSCCQADPVLFKQLWMNLLSNALESARTREQVRIEIGCRWQPRSLANRLPLANARADLETVYFVRDNGAGFDMKPGDKLFGVFPRPHRVADYEGTSDGMAVARRIVFRHGGRIWGESHPGQGTTFSFTLA